MLIVGKLNVRNNMLIVLSHSPPSSRRKHKSMHPSLRTRLIITLVIMFIRSVYSMATCSRHSVMSCSVTFLLNVLDCSLKQNWPVCIHYFLFCWTLTLLLICIMYRIHTDSKKQNVCMGAVANIICRVCVQVMKVFRWGHWFVATSTSALCHSMFVFTAVFCLFVFCRK